MIRYGGNEAIPASSLREAKFRFQIKRFRDGMGVAL